MIDYRIRYQKLLKMVSLSKSFLTCFIQLTSLRQRALLGAIAFSLVTGAAMGVAPIPSDEQIPQRLISETLTAPQFISLGAPSSSEQAGTELPPPPAAKDTSASLFIREERIQRGDSVASILNRLNASDPALFQFLKTDPSARSIFQLWPGRSVQVATDAQGTVQSLRYFHTPSTDNSSKPQTEFLWVQRHPASGLSQPVFTARDQVVDSERRVQVASGEIRSSLFAATDAADIPDSIATQIAEIFSGEIDFHRSLRKGDRFRVVYEMLYHQGEAIRAGRVLAVEFVNDGKTHQALWFDEGGQGAYYTFNGKSLRKAFLRSPLAFTRITSGFAMRFHPILHTWRQHKGVDYGAPSGTPIRSTADGVVEFIGSQGGYGNVVIIRHHGVYSTLYGHMQGFASGLKRGSRIEQGQLIGYVGSTGWATGPHLHYEFRVNSDPVDPLKVAMPDAPPLEGTRLVRFRQYAEPVAYQLKLVRDLQLASIK